MKYIFPNRTSWRHLLAACAIFLMSEVNGADREPSKSLLLDAAHRMAKYPMVEARVRQRINLFGCDVSGHGSYQQALIDHKMRLRYELRLPLGERGTHMQQINDGDYLWLHQELLDGPKLTVIDLRRARSALADLPERAERLEVVGGLVQILYGLHDHFDFGSPREDSLGKEPVWILEGTWRENGAGQGSPSRPPQVPQYVSLALSRDETLPLFPFRVEYSRDEPGKDGKSQRQVMMNVEFFEVRVGGSPDPRYFTFAAGDQAFHDATEEFVASLK